MAKVYTAMIATALKYLSFVLIIDSLFDVVTTEDTASHC